MRGLTVQHVRALYRVKYWDAARCDDLPAGLDLCVFDFAVNAGPNRAARYLQTMVGAKADGQIGPHTLSLVEQYVRGRGRAEAVMVYQDARADYYKLLKTFPTFGKGWLRRVREVEMAGVVMAKRAK
jgi:lysozyme family protein